MTETNGAIPLFRESAAQMEARWRSAYEAYRARCEAGEYEDDDDRSDDFSELLEFEEEIGKRPCASLEDVVAKLRILARDEETMRHEWTGPAIRTALEYLETLVKAE